MPDQHDTLATFAQIAVAIAGFSGIVIAFGHRSMGALTQLEVRRLSNLFTTSGFVLFSTLLSMALLYVESLEPTLLWRSQSALIILFGLPWMILDWFRIKRLEAEERAQVRAGIIYPFIFISMIGFALQMANIFWFYAPWPFYIGLVIYMLFAFQQFILLVRMVFRDA